MTAAVASLPTLKELQMFVQKALCAPDHLDPADSPLYQALITRSGRCCGLFFKVNGPRAVRVYAIWAGEENRILFYDSTGVRYAETRLSDAPGPAELMQDSAGQKKVA